jgi:hypothetical protein
MDNKLRIELINTLHENTECLQVLSHQVSDMFKRLLEAGDRMALGLGQDPDAEPLPPVMEFFDQVRISNDLLKDIMAVMNMLGRNHLQIAKALVPPTLQ